MKVKAEETVVIHIELAREEAEWLKATMQNPITEPESIQDMIYRKEFFNNLQSQGI